MKILITHYNICDYGGLVNDTEIMTRGFKTLKHQVHNIMLTPMDYGLRLYPEAGPVPRPVAQGWEPGIGTGLWTHPKLGWRMMNAFGFANRKHIPAWKKYANGFDLVIHQNPVPTFRKEYKGIRTWTLLYNLSTPQVAISPDANFRHAYPHLYEVVNRIQGVVCTHEASFRAASLLPTQRVLLPGPHIIHPPWFAQNSPKRQKGVFSAQNFKPIKHVDDFVRAVPYMKKGTKKILAGGGIEYHYMTSNNKMKPRYMTDQGVPIWQLAVANGMKFVGYLAFQEMEEYMQKMEVFLDCSWSKKYTAMGPHFNRTFIEAMNNGCIPICTDLGMGGSDIFKPGVHYVEIPAVMPDHARGGLLEDVLKSKGSLEEIRKHNFAKVTQFNHLYVCKEIIKLGLSKRCSGLLGKEMGCYDKELKRASVKAMEFFT